MKATVMICIFFTLVILGVFAGNMDNYYKRKATQFLTENGNREGVVTLPSGLQYEVLEKGTGSTHPSPSDTVEVHYTGTLIDGKEFDSSYKRGSPAKFGVGQVIKGWTEGLQLMVKGDKYKFFIPSSLGYGENGAGKDIPAHNALVFEVELISIVGKEEL
jgi:FKBP-type peptidyl-prolyl cis-trans isomerase